MKKKKINKSVLVGAVIGGVYALIPFLISIYSEFFYTGGGEGPGISYISFLIFFLTWITSYILLFPVELLKPYISTDFLFLIATFINIPLWIVIGGFFGRWLQRIRTKRGSKLK